MFDTLIVGAGLAGACAALFLSRKERVLVVDAAHPAAGASGIAAGLVNPLSGLRARPVWRMPEALDAFHEACALAGATTLFDGGGVLRPAERPDLAPWFEEAARTHPGHACWLPPDEAERRYPLVRAPFGAVYLPTSGAVAVPAFVAALLNAAEARGAVVRTGLRVTGWNETETHAAVTLYSDETAATETVAARRVLLAFGYGYRAFPELEALRLHPVKGQLVRVRTPAGLDGQPHLAGRGYVVRDGPSLVVGSTFEHTFADAAPSPEQTRRLLDNAAGMLPVLRDAEVVEAQAGIRVSVPGIRLPMLGPLPGRRRIWLFTGLGSKGLLMAPLLARDLPRLFDAPEHIPTEIRVRLQ